MLKKNREEHGLFIAEGVKVVNEMLHAKITVVELYGTPGFFEKNNIYLINKNVSCYELTAEELKRISALSTPNEVLAICRIPQAKMDYALLTTKLSLVLDDIKDPGNLGTIIRIADWFGIRDIICSNETVDAFNPKVIQATMGSIARINVHYKELTLFFKELSMLSANQLAVYGALLEGENIYKQQLKDTGLLIIGNESRGISDQLLPFITHRIKIPSFGNGSGGREQEAESLNAAVATAIICSEFKRNQ